ncbi:choline dehydrogenase [Favolaschia claudopus]|uniref:Choline dehydrogenase n=1 Tax=Favolaschia claudopus TaxID=2862362 RepID=A0AAV9ZC72_9AGAR
MIFLKAAFLTLLSSASAFALRKCSSTAHSEYDYIVVGSGAGGGPVAARLAENGYSVALIETGVDESSNVNTTSLLTAWSAIDDPKIDLDYRVKEYPPGFPVQRNDVWYPRSAGIGGCTIHNAGENSIGGLHETFDNLAQTFNDSSWSRDNMQNYWARVERNLYLTPPNPDHGFDGYINTIRGPMNFSSTDPQWQAIGDAIIHEAGPLRGDINSRVPLPHFAHSLQLWTGDTDFTRSSIRDRLTHVPKSKLTIMTNTLATRVLLCESSGKKVTAYGVAVAAGAKLPVAQGFAGKQRLDEREIVARREVIVSGGAFQTPQLLMLSGIGDRAQLKQFGIRTVVHLPGVGSNLQDNDEVPAWWEFNSNFTDANSIGEALSTSAGSTTLEADIDTYFASNQFSGFQHGISVIAANTHNVLTVVNLKAKSSSKGYVRLTGSHPQDLLDINKMRFQGPGGQVDIVALREAVKRWRAVINGNADIQKYLKREVSPGVNVTSDEDLDDYVLENVFAHHACCTAAIGPDDDPQAVLDGDFNVRGVKGLRVVDTSAWPEILGYFPASPMYMVAEKAADVILRDAKLD